MSEPETEYARKTRTRILAAAERRFKHYGFAKTTIVEIADDCAMSHANVYRFFRNKADLVDAIAAAWIVKSEKVCSEVAARPVSAKQRLVEFVIELHRWKRREHLRDKRAHELLMMAIHQGRPFVAAHLEVLADILVKIIEDGVARKEFEVRDPRLLAKIIQDATVKFCDPRLVAQYADEPLEAQAQDVMRVLIGGLEA
jgi:AcrR family transcriptional regulator